VKPIQELLDTLYTGVDAERVWRRTEAIWRSDTRMTSAAWRETAHYVAGELKKDGAQDVEIIECVADGETTLFGNRMWPIWEAREATLEILGSTPEVYSYRDHPRRLMTHSGPTPPEGILAEVVQIDSGLDESHYRGKDVEGKIVLTRAHGGDVARVAAKKGAIGVISDFIVTRDSHDLHWLPPLKLRELVAEPPNWDERFQWMQVWNGFEDGLFGFTLNRIEAERLRERIRGGERLRVRARVDSEFKKGTTPAVTAVIPGSSRPREEILVVSHLYEQGANDNASGCAASLEVASCLLGLIRSGQLPPPTRTVRLLYGLECQATAFYLTNNTAKIADTLAGLCLDNVGDLNWYTQSPMNINLNPDDRPSFTDALMEWLAREWLETRDKAYDWFTVKYQGGTDNFISEESIGIPCIWLGDASRLWHTSADTMEAVDRRSLVHASMLGTAYTYFCAAAGTAEACLALAVSEAYGQRIILDCAAAWRERLLQTTRGSAKLQAEAAEDLSTIGRRAVVRLETVLPLAATSSRDTLRGEVAAAQRRLTGLAYGMIAPEDRTNFLREEPTKVPRYDCRERRSAALLSTDSGTDHGGTYGQSKPECDLKMDSQRRERAPNSRGLDYRPDWEEARERTARWWQGGDIGRPAMVVYAPRNPPLEQVPEVRPPAGCGAKNYTTSSFDYRVNYARRYCLSTHFLGEAVPNVSSGDLAPNCLALYLGCKGVETADTVWCEPFLDETDSGGFDYDPRNSYWDFTLRVLRAVAPQAAGKFLQAFPDFIEGLDTLAAMRGTERLLTDLVEDPQWVHASLRRITDLYFRYYDLVYDLIRDDIGGSVFWTWAPGRVSKLQCDFSAMISPSMFKEFMVPVLEEMTERVSHSIYHWDGPGAVVHHDSLLALPDLDMIQWTPGAGIEPDWHERWWPLHHKTLDAGKKLMIGGGGREQLLALKREFGAKSKGMHLSLWAETVGEAERMIQMMEF